MSLRLLFCALALSAGLFLAESGRAQSARTEHLPLQAPLHILNYLVRPGGLPCAEAPTVLGPLEVLQVCEGDALEMSANPTGLTYRWLKDGQEIPSETDGKLKIKELQNRHEGLYTLEVSNACGTTTALPLRLVINALPPVPVVRSEDQQLFTSAEGDLQWLDHHLNPFPGETQPHFLPPAPGLYRVRVTDTKGCSSVSQPAMGVQAQGAMATAALIHPAPDVLSTYQMSHRASLHRPPTTPDDCGDVSDRVRNQYMARGIYWPTAILPGPMGVKSWNYYNGSGSGVYYSPLMLMAPPFPGIGGAPLNFGISPGLGSSFPAPVPGQFYNPYFGYMRAPGTW